MLSTESQELPGQRGELLADPAPVIEQAVPTDLGGVQDRVLDEPDEHNVEAVIKPPAASDLSPESMAAPTR